jgi:oligopeptidase B
MRYLFLIATLAFLFSCNDSQVSSDTSSAKPPVAKKIPKEFHEHGNTRTDDYFWMSDPKDSNVINHLKAENAYTESFMKHTEGFQKKIYDELVARIDQKSSTVPTKQNGYWYYTRYDEGKQYPYYCRKKNDLSAAEEIFLDIPEMAKSHQIFLVRGWSAAKNSNLLAYAIDTTGARRSTLYIKDLQSGKLLSENISNTSGSYAWSNDNKELYYTLNDHTVRSYKVMKHVIGTDPSTDKLIYTEKDSTFSVYVYPSRDNHYIFIASGSTNSDEVRYIDATKTNAQPVVIQPRTEKLEYSVGYNEGDVFHIRTNHNAENFKFVSAPVSKPGVDNWKDVIPHNEKAYLQSVEVLKNYFVVQSKVNGLTEIKVINRTDNSSYNVDFGEEAYVADLYLPTDDYALDSVRYQYSSLTTPQSDYSYNLVSKQKQLIKQQKVTGGFDPSKYETKRVWAKAGDGTMVPVSIVYRKEDFKKDGTNPLLLYAYGSYGANSDPYFNSRIISLLDRGFVYAIAHIRGGQELGRQWFENGRLLHKKNTFSDFVDCGQFLIDEKYCAKDKLFAMGGSAGGMLMGAVINLKPELFRGVIAAVPWMDVITDMFNADLPLTTLEYDQWGDPNKKEYYDYMLTWSPYDNVKKANYPAIFATGGLNDTQVPYFSPAKWVAKVRENNTGSHPVVFKCNMGAGHGGESGRFEAQKLVAMEYAFMLDQLGVNE